MVAKLLRDYVALIDGKFFCFIWGIAVGSEVHFHANTSEHMHKSACEWPWNGSIDPSEVQPSVPYW